MKLYNTKKVDLYATLGKLLICYHEQMKTFYLTTSNLNCTSDSQMDYIVCRHVSGGHAYKRFLPMSVWQHRPLGFFTENRDKSLDKMKDSGGVSK